MAALICRYYPGYRLKDVMQLTPAQARLLIEQIPEIERIMSPEPAGSTPEERARQAMLRELERRRG